MTGEPPPDGPGRCGERFLFSPSASYPRPLACLIDRDGRLVHAWSNTTGQPDPATTPPTWLRGWNHVELAADGGLYAMVPLHALLKLHPDSSLAWQVQIPVHHDLDITGSGRIYALTERPRMVTWSRGRNLLLDNQITIVSPNGRVEHGHSLYVLLITDPQVRALIDREISRRAGPHVPPPDLTGLDVAASRGGRDASRLLRELPGSPSDVLHTNTIEVLLPHPHGLWDGGDVLVSLRNLDLIAVVSLNTGGSDTGRSTGALRWWWGPGELSGQHQPSVLPGGNVLVFDNGPARQRSRVLEIDPSTGAIVWQYTADPPRALFSAMAGGCQQLPGGTVLISDAQSGRALEVARDGTTVWDLRIHTSPPTGEAVSRCQIYRLAAVPASATAGLTGGAGHARRLARARVRCRTRHDQFSNALDEALHVWSGP